MVLRGKVWLLRKINRKIDKDYIMIIVTLFLHVSSFPEARIIVQSLSFHVVWSVFAVVFLTSILIQEKLSGWENLDS